MNNKNSGFRMETLVHTKQGLKPIQHIRSGDLVLSNSDNQPPPNHARQEQEYIYRKVTKTLVTDDQTISKMVVVDLVNGKKEDILVTPNQPIYHNHSGWTTISKIEVGDVLENYIFGNLLVFRIYQTVEKFQVFNIEIEDFHTYYVGEQGVWFHS